MHVVKAWFTFYNDGMQKLREEMVLWLSTYGFDGWRLAILAILVTVSILAILALIRAVLLMVFKRLNKTAFYDHFDFWYSLMKKISVLGLLTIALAISSLVMPLSPSAAKLVDTILLILLMFFLVSLIQNTIFDFAIYVRKYLPSKLEKKMDKTAITFLRVVVSILLWVIAIIIILRVWNYDVTALLGGLGVASIILTLSMQGVLKDIFAFFTFYADKSFAVGDYIVTGPNEGTVREIRLRTTRITAPSGEDLIIANNKLIEQVMANFNNLPARRTSLDIHVEKHNETKSIEKVIEDLRKWFPVDDELVTLDYVYLHSLLELSNVINVVYHYKSSDYAAYLAHREQVNLAILRICDKHGVKLSNRYKILKEDSVV